MYDSGQLFKWILLSLFCQSLSLIFKQKSVNFAVWMFAGRESGENKRERNSCMNTPPTLMSHNIHKNWLRYYVYRVYKELWKRFSRGLNRVASVNSHPNVFHRNFQENRFLLMKVYTNTFSMASNTVTNKFVGDFFPSRRRDSSFASEKSN